jgi:two-component system nitrogen regulation response regulator GlnG
MGRVGEDDADARRRPLALDALWLPLPPDLGLRSQSMAPEGSDAETLDFSASATGGGEGRLVGLTLLQHPDLSRVGQIAPLFGVEMGGQRSVSRLEPEFRFSRESVGLPLESLALTRAPLVIRTDEHRCVWADPCGRSLKARVQGQPLDAPRGFPPEALASGIVIELSGCVVLLLHWIAQDQAVQDMGLLGESLAIRAVRADVTRVADLDVPVLIRGETGSGKELVARAIHGHSPRAKRPFVAVNMAAIPSSMAAASLFGHMRGAFTGAVSSEPGYFGAADSGTLFLDEIGETPRDVQASLLRALREGEIQPVGATSIRKVDVRVLTATDANLEQRASHGEFSLPLLRRIEGFTIQLPPLRARRDDIARLFFHFVRSELRRLSEEEKLSTPPPGGKPWLPTWVVECLLGYDWPGNVAELETLTMRLAVSNRGRRRFHFDDVLARRLGAAPGGSEPPAVASNAPPAEQTTPPPRPRSDPAALSDAEIVAAMRHTAFKVRAAAQALGVSRSWLNTRLEFCEGLRKAKDLTREELMAAGQSCVWNPGKMAQTLEVSEHGLKLRMAALDLRQA